MTTLIPQQAFTIPFSPRADLTPSRAGWSIWTFTDLDWHLLRGLPEGGWLRRYRCCEDVNEETLLAECQWAEEWGGLANE